MTGYSSLNDLMIVSDVLISDYSSIFFDYSIMDKSMFHFTYDYEGGNIFQKIAEKYGSIFIPIKKKGQEINITRLLELNREL